MTSRVEYLGGLRTRNTHLKSGAQIETDAPTDNHGQGALFSPTDLAATSLANCMITVMGIKAEQNGISFNAVSADVKKVMSSGPRRIKEIHVELKIEENWTVEEKKLMEETALNCPVALSLHPDIEQLVKFRYM